MKILSLKSRLRKLAFIDFLLLNRFYIIDRSTSNDFLPLYNKNMHTVDLSNVKKERRQTQYLYIFFLLLL